MEVRRQVSERELDIIQKIRTNLDGMRLKRKRLIRSRVEGAMAVIVKRPDLEMSERIRGLELIKRVSEELGSGGNAARVRLGLLKMLGELNWKTSDLRAALKAAATPSNVKAKAASAGRKTKKFLIDDGWIIIIGIAVVIIVVVLIVIILAILTEGKALDGLGSISKLPFDGKVLQAVGDFSPGVLDLMGRIVPQESLSNEEWFRKKMEEKMSGL